MGALIGIYRWNHVPICSASANHMLNTLARFPADSVSTWKKENIFLGCHHQWITTESVGERLPYYDSERKLAITADAIIDNRVELLERLGIRITEQSHYTDSQLILLAYAKWGVEVPNFLMGDFAFVIWDEKEQKLFGARDFSGARTLYFHHDNRQLMFATRMESLFAYPGTERKLNETWLAEFIAIPTIVEAVDMQHTVYQDIHQLPPSHCFTVQQGKMTIQRYFRMTIPETLQLATDGEYEEAFRDVLRKSIQVRLRAKGHTAAHLSGGLDSGSVASLAAETLQGRNEVLHTYSYVPTANFVDWTPSYYEADESSYIRDTASFSENIAMHVEEFPGQSAWTGIDDFLDVMEMPFKFFNNTFWLQGIHEKAREQGCSILLSGARGNHSISWGSMTLTFDYYAKLAKRLQWIKLYRELDAYCQRFHTGKSVMIPFVAKRIFHRSKGLGLSSPFPRWIHRDFARRTNVYERLADYGMDISGHPPLQLGSYRNAYYQQLFAWNKSGVACTNLSLKYGLWDRDPTNDLNVIRFCLSLPEEQYARDGMSRSIIRRAMRGYLPDRVRFNQSSRGLQGADTIQRMLPTWNVFLSELHEMVKYPWLQEFVDMDQMAAAIKQLGDTPRPEMIFEDALKLVTRCLVVYRFLSRLETGRG
ncbi:asparagine synthetase B [Ornithinibacillus gellani]|uniref:asparagine synthase-related protein n=1 Tax=Ornithinibacillus gellani TaxID=2293253 RepID=UPI000F47D1D7|nr:asparagine synthase-related protein [Ornithinibacillus gellani]TQS74114.1 asparagine synthetase B [Ornithinibacillus gellani]